MNEQEKVEKLKEVFADKAFTEKVMGLETVEEVQTALADKGVELSVQEINDIRDALVKQMESGEELDSKELKTVAGGLINSILQPVLTGIFGRTDDPQSSRIAAGSRW